MAETLYRFAVAVGGTQFPSGSQFRTAIVGIDDRVPGVQFGLRVLYGGFVLLLEFLAESLPPTRLSLERSEAAVHEGYSLQTDIKVSLLEAVYNLISWQVDNRD